MRILVASDLTEEPAPLLLILLMLAPLLLILLLVLLLMPLLLQCVLTWLPLLLCSSASGLLVCGTRIPCGNHIRVRDITVSANNTSSAREVPQAPAVPMHRVTISMCADTRPCDWTSSHPSGSHPGVPSPQVSLSLGPIRADRAT